MQKIARRKVAEYTAQQLADGVAPKVIASQLVAYLVDAKQTNQLELLIRDIQAALVARGTVAIDITSARELDDAARKIISSFVAKAEHAESVVITHESVDPDLIGGVVVHTPDRVFDGSVRKSLKNLTAKAKAV